jgi:hypothetical protein
MLVEYCTIVALNARVLLVPLREKEPPVWAYDRERVKEIAEQHNFESWKCICVDDGNHGSNGTCYPCITAELLCWECGEIEICADDCRLSAALLANADAFTALDHAELVDAGILDEPSWMRDDSDADDTDDDTKPKSAQGTTTTPND